jgi:hypothetical protein
MYKRQSPKRKIAHLYSVLWKICLQAEHFSGIDIRVVRVLERFLQLLSINIGKTGYPVSHL